MCLGQGFGKLIWLSCGEQIGGKETRIKTAPLLLEKHYLKKYQFPFKI